MQAEKSYFRADKDVLRFHSHESRRLRHIAESVSNLYRRTLPGKQSIYLLRVVQTGIHHPHAPLSSYDPSHSLHLLLHVREFHMKRNCALWRTREDNAVEFAKPITFSLNVVIEMRESESR